MGFDVFAGMGTLLSLKVDHRTSGRIAARKNLSTILELDEGDLLVGSVVDVSNRGLGLRLELPEKFHSHIHELISVRGRLRIGQEGDALLDQPCEIRHSAVDIHPNLEKQAILGVALPENISVPIDQLEFRRDNEVIDLIEGPEAISEIVRDLVLIGSDAIISMKAGENIFRGLYRHDTKLKSITSLRLELLDAGATSVLTDRFTYTFFMEIYGSFYLFRTRIKKCEGNLLELVIPDSIVRVTRRLTKRVAPNEGEAFVAKFSDPFLGSPISARIENFTERGLSAIVDDDSFTLPAGTLLPDLELQFGSGPTVRVIGSVVHCRLNPSGSVTTGINIANNTSSLLMPIFDFVIPRRYLGIYRLTEEDLAGNWELLEKAGYLETKHDSDMGHIRDQAIDAWRKLSRSNNELSKNWIFLGKDAGVTGGIHITRLYNSSWLTHHLSIIQGHQRTVTPALFGSICDFVIQSADYLVSYTDATKSWNKKNYYEFSKLYASDSDNHLHEYDLVQFNIAGSTGISVRNKSVRLATDYDRIRIAKHLRECLPTVQLKAFDLLEDTIIGDRLAEKYLEKGLYRDRKFFVYGSGDEIVAFVMCDAATDGVNIFSLLDKCELFTLDQTKTSLIEVKTALLQKTIEHYRSLNKEAFLYFTNDFDLDIYLDKLPGKLIHKAVMWITNKRMMPRYKDYNARLFGRIMARRNQPN